MKLEIYDPSMCCSTGVCGSEVDQDLVRFAGDLEWLKRQGVEITRYNLAQSPGEFVARKIISDTLTKDGNKCLPLILWNGEIAASAQYPSREVLAKLANVPLTASESSCCKGSKCCG